MTRLLARCIADDMTLLPQIVSGKIPDEVVAKDLRAILLHVLAESTP